VARTIDLNADLGEATDPEGVEAERALLAVVTTAHVACGGHAGDDVSMAETAQAARQHSVRVGAHPSYPDREGFGRRPMTMACEDLRTALADQLRALRRACATAGTDVESVKAHGALYEEVAKGGAVYEALRDAVRDTCRPETTLVLPSGCRATATALRDDMRALEEGFCDRAYRADGGLVSRTVPGVVLSDPAAASAQAVSLARGAVVADDGSVLTLWVDTLCVHGDTPGALAIATSVRRAIVEAGIDVVGPTPQ
jgi:UPF0271 protein